MKQVLYVVGPPGVGKTTLVRALLGEGLELVPKPKWTVGPKVCAVGHYNGGTFDGADTVPYNGVQAGLDYWAANLSEKPLTILDGDRFSYAKVVEWWKAQGVQVKCALLTTFDDVLDARRAARGSNQNPTWMKGRVTKAINFAHSIPGHLAVDAGPKLEEVLARVREYIAR